MKYIKILLLFSIFFNSCNNFNEEKGEEGTNLEFGYYFKFIDESGINLLHNEKIQLDDLKFYDKVVDSLVEGTKYIFLYDIGSQDSIPDLVALPLGLYDLENSDGKLSGIRISYIDLNNSDRDTIKTKWKQGPNHFIVGDIWYNGVQKKGAGIIDGEPYIPYITIIK
ncbi:MAG: hypothetical protein U9N31_06405 [Candidatus Marinimicrobia bacterium]|nr:hypothetical protein [Candidatus Neomarinimicrobiota bacterium]